MFQLIKLVLVIQYELKFKRFFIYMCNTNYKLIKKENYKTPAGSPWHFWCNDMCIHAQWTVHVKHLRSL